ncbi:MAG TPA: hypothetical protein VMW64_06910 [Dehalococcoidia bacterium]|nr:hypothetical protein [Dehalococcoidia bacterium]
MSEANGGAKRSEARERWARRAYGDQDDEWIGWLVGWMDRWIHTYREIDKIPLPSAGVSGADGRRRPPTPAACGGVAIPHPLGLAVGRGDSLASQGWKDW